MPDVITEPSAGPTVTTDPATGLRMVELSHVWGHGVPSLPGEADVRMVRAVKHAQHGVMAHRVTTVMHTGTHMNAPIHLIQRGADLAAIPVDRFFGNGAVLDVPKKRWEVVTAADLQAARPAIKRGDIVVIVTGWHHKYSDGLEYYGESPGLSKDAAEWLVTKDRKLVAVDTPQVDHPLATSLGPHRGGPTMKRLAGEYTGGDRPRPQGGASRSGTSPTGPCSPPASRPSSRSAATSTCRSASGPPWPRRRGSSSTVTPARSGWSPCSIRAAPAASSPATDRRASRKESDHGS